MFVCLFMPQSLDKISTSIDEFPFANDIADTFTDFEPSVCTPYEYNPPYVCTYDKRLSILQIIAQASSLTTTIMATMVSLYTDTVMGNE